MSQSKKYLITLAVLTPLLVHIPSALALEIKVTPQGDVQFFDDSVLGDTTAKTEKMEKQAVKVVPAAANQQLNIQREDDNFKVGMTKSATKNAKFTSTETTESNQVNLEMPAALTEEQIKLRQAQNKYQQQLLEERKLRKTEKIELKNQENNDEMLELESRAIKADVKNGAQFTIDPKTNAVTIITPSGQEHVLNHLPDQAIEQMMRQGKLDSKQDSTSLQLENDDQTGVKYSVTTTKEKKLLGLFKRAIPTKVELDDATGEVSETELPANSMLNQWLDMFSF